MADTPPLDTAFPPADDSSADVPSAAPSSPAGPPAPERFVFTGSGSEYFRIWIVNLALTFLTLGIYSPWAKVRRMQYLYRNTLLAGSGFDYHGKPVAILKGRAIAVGLIALHQGLALVDQTAAGLVAILIGLVMPWLLLRSLAFRLANTSWRGLRFRFEGTSGGAYRVFLLWPFLASITFGLLSPAAHRALKQWQHTASAFGRTRFAFAATIGEFYRVWLRTAGLVVAAPALVIVAILATARTGVEDVGGTSDTVAAGFMVLGVVGVVMFYLGLLSAMPYFVTRMQNLVWSRTTLGPHRFESDMRFRRTLNVMAANMFLTVVTLGLYRPFAVIRMARYRVEAMTLVPGDSLDHFVGQQAGEVEALGEAAAEFFDIDIAL
jgi:uncharacterized membrane protein YjgN (DUF898 family)